jgi:phosphonopyruvate decarboxylase
MATTEFMLRELFALREHRRETHTTDFLTIGSMCHCCQIALKIALSCPTRTIYCLDGDGSALMHLGGLAVIGHILPQNFTHIIFNNAVHDSVGGQPIAAPYLDFSALAFSLGYKFAVSVPRLTDIKKTLSKLGRQDKPALLSIQTQSGARSNLGRPTITPITARDQFMMDLQTKA